MHGQRVDRIRALTSFGRSLSAEVESNRTGTILHAWNRAFVGGVKWTDEWTESPPTAVRASEAPGVPPQAFELRRDNRAPDYSREYTLLIAKRPYRHRPLRSPTLPAHPVRCILVGGLPAAVNRSRPTT